jgi:plastocyanin domain-containing protein
MIIAGVAAIVWVNWYFFFAGRSVASATAGSGVQELTITVHGGYEPATVRVTQGVPVRLMFDRQETSSCSEEVVFPDFGIRRFLPAFQKTAIEFTPTQAGRYEFMCGMSMLHGAVIVDASH